MGLDMYLWGDTLITSYDYHRENGDFIRTANPKYAEIANLCGQTVDLDNFGMIKVQIPVMQWRKANQIHKWFVDECQGGVDNCQYAEVSADQLQELVGEIKTALDHKDSTILPPQSGFFFGSTDIDQYYWEDLESTYKVLKLVLDEERYEYFTYHSSW